ncbi:unnamed protein product, partial [Closterium sp. Naga37s-1]
GLVSWTAWCYFFYTQWVATASCFPPPHTALYLSPCGYAPPLQGLVLWTACCYFFYTQWVATVARTFAASLTPNSPVLDELKW